MNYEKIGLLIQIVEFALLCSVFSTSLNQSLKSIYKWNTTLFNIISCITSITLGTSMALLFSDFTLTYAIFNGVVVLIGAKGLYEQLNKMGIVKSIKDHNAKNVVEIPKENELKYK